MCAPGRKSRGSLGTRRFGKYGPGLVLHVPRPLPRLLASPAQVTRASTPPRTPAQVRGRPPPPSAQRKPALVTWTGAPITRAASEARAEADPRATPGNLRSYRAWGPRDDDRGDDEDVDRWGRDQMVLIVMNPVVPLPLSTLVDSDVVDFPLESAAPTATGFRGATG